MPPQDTVRLELDLGQSTQKTQEFAKALDTVAVISDQSVVPALNRVDSAVERTATVSHTLRGDSRPGGGGILGISYAIQDFTSQIHNGFVPALGAIQNNIPQVLSAIGIGPGLAGVISIVTVGAGALTAALHGSNEEAKELAKNAKDAAQALERIKTIRTEEEEKKAETVEGFIKGVGGAKVSAGIEQAMGIAAAARAREAAEYIARQEQIPGTEAFAARVLQRGGRPIDIAESTSRAREDAMRTIPGQADDLLRRVASGDNAAAFELARLARAHPERFPRGFADDVASFARDTGDDDLRAAEEFGERARAGGRGRARLRAQREAMGDLATEEARAEREGREAWEASFATMPPPPFFARRLPVGRIDEGPLAAGARPAVMSPAQRRALVREQLEQAGAAAPLPQTYRPRRPRAVISDEERTNRAADLREQRSARDAAAAAAAMAAITTTSGLLVGIVSSVQNRMRQIEERNARQQEQLRQQKPVQMARTGTK